MGVAIMLIELVIILAVFAGIVFGVWYLFVLVLKKMQELKFLKKQNSERMYCLDCEKTFYTSESVKTDVGIYPCPKCASNKTCLDTLESKKKQEFINK